MATTKKRLNITLSPQAEKLLASIAKRDNVPQATKAFELLTLALEMEEDAVLGSLAKARDTKDARYIAHNEVWK